MIVLIGKHAANQLNETLQNNTDRINYFICIRFLLRVIIICIQMEAVVAFIGYINGNLA